MLYQIVTHRESLRLATDRLREATDGLQRHLSSHDSQAPDPGLVRAAEAITTARRTVPRNALSPAAMDRLVVDVCRGWR